MTVSFRVFGVPQPQGSARAFVQNGKAHITSANKNLGDWRRLIADCAQRYAHMHEGAVEVTLTFYLPRPKSLGKKIVLPAKRPDIDKLVRTWDSLTGIMWADDSQVTDVTACKRYADEANPPGVHITIQEKEPVI